MKKLIINLILCLYMFPICPCAQNSNLEDSFSHYPSTVISNGSVTMKIYLPDPEKGLYRATRFDWSGVIGSVQYKGHEYFGYWKNTHDPMFHEDLPGPVEGFSKPGLGYAEAIPGGNFVRIGIGVIKKENESEYQQFKTYEIIDHGKWTIHQGTDWIEFIHEVNSDIGYAYIYTKRISLKDDAPGFKIEHRLQNTGEKDIETDQFNHNFFMIDEEKSGPALSLRFPYPVETNSDLKGYLEIEDKDVNFVKDLIGTTVYMVIEGYSDSVEDHKVTVLNKKTGAGVTFTVDKPLHKMVFWACETTLCPENFIWISAKAGEEEKWISDYSLFIN